MNFVSLYPIECEQTELKNMENPFEEQQIPDILKFYTDKELTRNASLTPGYELVETSDVIEDEEKIKDAISLVRIFAKYPDRTALTAFKTTPISLILLIFAFMTILLLLKLSLSLPTKLHFFKKMLCFHSILKDGKF